MLEIIHAVVPGRTRFKVKGLFGSGKLKHCLEQRLIREKFVREVSASDITGNILVSYNSNSTMYTVGALIERVLQEETVRHPIGRMHECRKKKDRSSKEVLPNPVPLKAERKKNRDCDRRKTVRLPAAPASADMEGPSWHTTTADAVMKQMQTDRRQGLDLETAAHRLQQHGPNLLPESAARRGMGYHKGPDPFIADISARGGRRGIDTDRRRG